MVSEVSLEGLGPDLTVHVTIVSRVAKLIEVAAAWSCDLQEFQSTRVSGLFKWNQQLPVVWVTTRLTGTM